MGDRVTLNRVLHFTGPDNKFLNSQFLIEPEKKFYGLDYGKPS